MRIFNFGNIRVMQLLLYYNFTKERGIQMIKFLAKLAEKYAKATNTACFTLWIGHQAKMPASLIKKD